MRSYLCAVSEDGLLKKTFSFSHHKPLRLWNDDKRKTNRLSAVEHRVKISLKHRLSILANSISVMLRASFNSYLRDGCS